MAHHNTLGVRNPRRGTNTFQIWKVLQRLHGWNGMAIGQVLVTVYTEQRSGTAEMGFLSLSLSSRFCVVSALIYRGNSTRNTFMS